MLKDRKAVKVFVQLRGHLMTRVHRLVLFLAILCGLGCFAAGRAQAATVYWYEQGGCGGFFSGSNWDCYSLSSGGSGWTNGFVNNTGAANFIPNGDCQTYPGHCYGGYGGAPNGTQSQGTWCSDYGNPGGFSSSHCVDWGNGVWTLATGNQYGQPCPCGTYLLPSFGASYSNPQANDYPFTGYYGSNPALWVFGQQNNTTISGLFHAYFCFELNTASKANWIEDCEYTYRTGDINIDHSDVACIGATGGAYISNWFNANPDPYATDIPFGSGETSGNGPTGNILYGFITSAAQLHAALNAMNGLGGCGHYFDTNPSDYFMTSVESGIETWKGSGSANQTEQGLMVETQY